MAEACNGYRRLLRPPRILYSRMLFVVRYEHVLQPARMAQDVAYWLNRGAATKLGCQHTHARTHACTHANTHTHASARARAHTLIHRRIHARTHANTHTHACMRTRYTRAHTHTQTHPRTRARTHRPAKLCTLMTSVEESTMRDRADGPLAQV